MTRAALAKALLRRQLRAGLQPKAVIHAVGAEGVLASYLECSGCRQRLYATPESERMAIGLATNAEHFAQLCNTALNAHNCPAKGSAQN